MKKLNFYRAFVPWWYFYLVILFPLLTPVFLYFERIFFHGIGFFTILWLDAEILFEHFFMGGLHSKQSVLPEYLKTSAHGKLWFQGLIRIDIFRRAVSSGIVAFGTTILWYGKCTYIVFLLFTVLYLLTSICAYLGRYSTSWILSFMLAMAGIVIYVILLFLLKHYPIAIGICFFPALGITYALWRKAIQKWEESFYEK